MSTQRALSIVWGYGIALSVLWPLVATDPQDSFPISTYPMFTADRTVVEILSMVRLEPGASMDTATSIPPGWIASSEPMMAVATLRRALREGPQGMSQLCIHVQSTMAREDSSSLDRLHIVMQSINTLAFARSLEAPTPRRILFSCPEPQTS